MGRPKSHNDADVLDRAIEVFWTHGFDGTSVSDLVDQLGINRGTMYAFFGDKEALYNQALTEYARRLAEDRDTRLGSLDDPMSAIAGWLNWLAEGAVNEPTRRGCFIGAAALERLPEHTDTTRIVEADLEHSRRLLTEALARARDLGQINPDIDLIATAALLNTLAQGVRVLAKAGPGSTTATLAMDAALASLGWPG